MSTKSKRRGRVEKKRLLTSAMAFSDECMNHGRQNVRLNGEKVFVACKWNWIPLLKKQNKTAHTSDSGLASGKYAHALRRCFDGNKRCVFSPVLTNRCKKKKTPNVTFKRLPLTSVARFPTRLAHPNRPAVCSEPPLNSLLLNATKHYLTFPSPRPR